MTSRRNVNGNSEREGTVGNCSPKDRNDVSTDGGRSMVDEADGIAKLGIDDEDAWIDGKGGG